MQQVGDAQAPPEAEHEQQLILGKLVRCGQRNPAQPGRHPAGRRISGVADLKDRRRAGDTGTDQVGYPVKIACNRHAPELESVRTYSDRR